MKIAVLYHNDEDGFGAAYACRKAFDSDNPIFFQSVQYDQPVPELPATIEELFVVDFSYDRATCETLAEKYKLVILDHHKTAKKELAGLPCAIFDMSRSGAVIAWEYFFLAKGIPVPAILQYVQDRDLWKFELEFSEEVNLYIAAMPQTFEAWDGFQLDNAITAGKAIKAFRDSQIERAIKNVRFEVVAGYTVPILNLSDNISEVGNEMCKRFPSYPFSLSYCDLAGDKRKYSLRSIGKFDVSAIAKQFGGGGHRNTAGFTKEIAGPC